MKKLVLISIALLIAAGVLGQTPQKMSYQCVVRNTSGTLVTNQAVGLKISILQGSTTGTVVFSETFNPNPQTNANGLLTVEIGSGTTTTGTLAGIDWGAGSFYLKTETDPAGGTNYTIAGTSQLLSVPYAMYAKSAANGFSGNYNDLSNKPSIFNGAWTDISGKPTSLTGFGISDAMSTTHAANGITSSLILNWNTAFSWGDHEGLYKASTYTPNWVEVTGKPVFASVATTGTFADLLSKPTTLPGYGITDAMSTAHAANNITAANITNWNAAFGWGTHTGLYRPISYVPTWSEVTSKPTTLEGYGITNAMSTSHPANAITTTNITNWTSVFGWGNHATAGYAVYPSLTGNAAKFLTNNGAAVSWGTLSTAAISGSYNDLINKPVISPKMTDGSNTGDMLYWNGSAWVTIPVGTAGQYLQLSASKIPVWAGPQLITITTTAISSILANSAISGGNISSDGGASVIVRGICWNTSGSPITANSKTENGGGTGTFTSTMNGLSPNTLYYVRAYAVNSAGTSYGDQKNFTTSPVASDPQWSIFNPNLNYGSVTDINGNTYKTILIGTQTWMAQSLRTTKFNDGTSVPELPADYTNYVTPGYSVRVPDDVTTFGLCYNWYTLDAAANGGRNVCPTGWHVPTDDEWMTLENYLINNGYNYDGTIGGANNYAVFGRNKIAKALGSASLIWIQSVGEGSIGNEDYPEKRNMSGFSALPFVSPGDVGYYWTSTSALTTLAWDRLFINGEQGPRREANFKYQPLLVRCVKD